MKRLLPRAFAIALFAWGTSTAGAQTILQFSHVVAADTPKGKAADFFAKKAAELTHGKVVVKVYPNSTLLKDPDEIAALQAGTVQMLAPSLAKFGALGVKEFEVFDLPFLFDDREDLHRITNGPVGAKLMAKLEPKGITGLAFWDNGFKSFSANTALRAPADFRGRKFRIQPSKVLEEEIRSLGGTPQVIAFDKTYQSLQQGVVDGTENPPSNFFTQKMYKVQKHLTLTHHGYLGYAVIVNKKFWDGLPSDIRTQLTQAMKLATAFANQIAQEENDLALDGIRRTGTTAVYSPSREERQALKKTLLPVHERMSTHIGADILQDIYRETSFKPGSF